MKESQSEGVDQSQEKEWLDQSKSQEKEVIAKFAKQKGVFTLCETC